MFSNLSSKKFYMLDGGFSAQLSKYDKNFEKHPLWTSYMLYKNPDIVHQTYKDYMAVGCDIIETNTYQASIPGFQKYLDSNLTEEECKELIFKAVSLAKDARHELQKDDQVLIAGSIGSFGAYLHDGSEYSGNYIKKHSLDEIEEFHRSKIEILLTAGVDLLAFETIPISEEAELICKILKDYDEACAWLSFSCKNANCISSGENFQAVAKRCYDSNPRQIIAVGVNCCKPDHVVSLFKDINADRKGREIPLIAYPNSGEVYDKQKGWLGASRIKSLETFVPQWLNLGVKFIGGCCRINAQKMKQVREVIDNHKI